MRYSKKEDAIAEANRAVNALAAPRNAIDGPGVQMNLALCNAWTNEPDQAFEHWTFLPNCRGFYYGNF